MKFKWLSTLGVLGALVWSTHASATPVTSTDLVSYELDTLIGTIGKDEFNALAANCPGANGGNILAEECWAADLNIFVDPVLNPTTKDETVTVTYNGDLPGFMLPGNTYLYILKNATGTVLS